MVLAAVENAESGGWRDAAPIRGETPRCGRESGCGKSTFARAIIGLVKATDGKVAWLGKDLLGMKQEEWRDVRSDIQMIFQDPLASLNPRA